MQDELAASRTPAMKPPHPGAILRDDVLPALGVSVKDAATELGVSPQVLRAVLAERAPVTADLAVRLGKWCGNGPRLWHALQRDRDLWEARARLAEQVDHIPTRSAA